MQDDEIITTPAPDESSDAAPADGTQDAADAAADTAALAAADADTAAYQQQVIADLAEIREIQALNAGGTLLLAGIVIGCMIVMIVRGWVHG